MVWRNWAGEFISSRTSNRVMMSTAIDGASLFLDRGEECLLLRSSRGGALAPIT